MDCHRSSRRTVCTRRRPGTGSRLGLWYRRSTRRCASGGDARWRHVTFTTGKRGDTVIVRVEGQLIVGNRQELKQLVLDQVDNGERKFLIDFGQTGYIDSSGLGLLVSLSKKVRERGGDVRLANLNDDLRTLFKLTKLDRLFRLD